MRYRRPEDRLGTKIAGKYELTELLGKGGMGLVYGGRHSWTGHEVAVKVLLPHLAEDEGIVHRFLTEAQAAAKIKDRHVVRVLDMGQDVQSSSTGDSDEVYLVLERLHGETLKARLKRGPLSIEEAYRLLAPIMRALAKAHDLGIIHRDLKPDNIYLAEEDGKTVPKLLDFGIAKITMAGLSGRTATGVLMGTPWYMSPEQAKGQRDLTPALDVWGMAVLFFVCVSAKLPYTAKNPAEVLYLLSSKSSEMLALARVRPGTPAAVSEVIARCLLRDRDLRPTMSEMVEALGEAVEGTAPRMPRPTPAAAEAPRPVAALDKSTDQDGPPDLERAPLEGGPGRASQEEDPRETLSFEETLDSAQVFIPDELEGLPPLSLPPSEAKASAEAGESGPDARASLATADAFPHYSATYAVTTEVSEGRFVRTESVSIDGELGPDMTDLDDALEDGALEDGALEDGALEDGALDEPDSGERDLPTAASRPTVKRGKVAAVAERPTIPRRQRVPSPERAPSSSDPGGPSAKPAKRPAPDTSALMMDPTLPDPPLGGAPFEPTLPDPVPPLRPSSSPIFGSLEGPSAEFSPQSPAGSLAEPLPDSLDEEAAGRSRGALVWVVVALLLLALAAGAYLFLTGGLGS